MIFPLKPRVIRMSNVVSEFSNYLYFISRLQQFKLISPKVARELTDQAIRLLKVVLKELDVPFVDIEVEDGWRIKVIQQGTIIDNEYVIYPSN